MARTSIDNKEIKLLDIWQTQRRQPRNLETWTN